LYFIPLTVFLLQRWVITAIRFQIILQQMSVEEMFILNSISLLH